MRLPYSVVNVRYTSSVDTRRYLGCNVGSCRIEASDILALASVSGQGMKSFGYRLVMEVLSELFGSVISSATSGLTRWWWY